MHFSTPTLLTALLYTTTAHAGCFTGGEPWHDKALAGQKVVALCNTWSKIEMVPGTTLSACENGPQGVRFNFAVYNFSSDKRRVGEAECVENLNKEVNGCNTGGRSSYEFFEFTSDPNAGAC